MKRIISLIIALCLVLGSFSFSFAVEWNSSQISSVVNDVNIISASIDDLFTAFAGQTGIMYNTISEMMSWLTPVGSFNSSDSLTGFTLYEMIDYICYLLGYSGTAVATVYDLLTSTSSNIANINGNIISWMGSNNNFLDLVSKGVGFTNYTGEYTYWLDIYKTAHRQLLYTNPNGTSGTKMDGTYYLPYIYNDGRYTLNGTSQNWRMGTPLGNIALILKRNMELNAMSFNYRWLADLKHYNDQLTTWDSQGNTLTQVAFTPESAIQGLYRYLAYTQRDVARLAYVVANDEELDAREKAQTNQSAVVDEFIDPSGSGSISASNFGSLSDVSGEMKTNFSTGQSASGVFNVFDDQHFGYLTQGTADSLDTSGSNTRLLKASGSEYPTPTLDRYYEELNKILEVNTDD